MDRETTYINTKLTRHDAVLKAAGKVKYGTDLELPSMLFGKVLRSPYPHAKILDIDTQKAKKHPGIEVVITGEDVPYRTGRIIDDQPFLAINKVRYIGEPVVAVAGISEKAAEEALALIKVKYEPLPAIFDAEQAVDVTAPLVHEDLVNYWHSPRANPIEGTNICTYFKVRKGDVEKGFAEADYVIEDRYTTPETQHCCIEPQVCIAQVGADRIITLWASTQSPNRLKTALGRALGIPEQRFRVIVPFLGGGFGENSGAIEPLAVALALHSNGKPVKVALNRHEQFTATITKHSTVVYIKTGFKTDGSIAAREVKAIFDTGAYAHTGPTVCKFSGYTAAGPYKIANVKIDAYCVYTNKIPAGSFRGYGTPQMAWAYENHTDKIARKLGCDPLTFRLRNVLDFGDKTATGEVIDCTALKTCLTEAAAAIGWGSTKRTGINSIRYGKGIACGWKATGSPLLPRLM